MALQPIGQTFRAYMKRLRVNRAFMRGLHDEIVPVALVSRDYSDQARPLWLLSAITPTRLLGISSASLTSAFDVAIYYISVATFDRFGTGVEATVTMGMPPSTYIPFLNDTATFTAGVRPRLSFDVGNTVAVVGNNPLAAPIIGLQETTFRFTVGGIFIPLLDTDDPLILPARMFLTVQAPVTDLILVVNFRYRELGRDT